ncbi:MAG: hypothetical protein BD935_01350 [Marine Group III euryarchaeote CG-Epi1]|jgi:aminomethyltransferase|uniref:aminomethyltransferase n=1 Tax=Marine Group III euryarchaeote CG-Epi1 TaxID=1888995 RepID=A0A1J5TRS3_9ARCH|nr:MAG: hypothetical protein BD935_01350 [Marine Group III euryarchaeote CG-Epi1]
MSLSQTCLHDNHVRLGAKMVDFAGWHMPIQYTSIVSEHNAVRERVGIFDVSHMGQIFISGKDASSFLSYVTTWDVNKLSEGDCRYCHILNNDGQIIDDTIVYTFSNQDYMLVPNASMISKVFDWLNLNSSNFEVNIYNKSEEFFCLAVQGPESLRLLRQYFNLSITPFKLIKSDNLIISGTGYTGEKGYEIMGPISESQNIWESFLEMGAIPIGLGARDTLRLEKGYLLSGTDFNGSQTTLESGYSWVIDWNHDFIGKERLLVQKDGEYKSLSGILLEERGVLRPGLEVYFEGEKISALTSGSLSPILKRGIGLSYLDLPIGTTVNVSIRNKQLKGRVIQTPFL